MPQTNICMLALPEQSTIKKTGQGERYIKSDWLTGNNMNKRQTEIE
jgi:hypothetical protein